MELNYIFWHKSPQKTIILLVIDEEPGYVIQQLANEMKYFIFRAVLTIKPDRFQNDLYDALREMIGIIEND